MSVHAEHMNEGPQREGSEKIAGRPERGNPPSRAPRQIMTIGATPVSDATFSK